MLSDNVDAQIHSDTTTPNDNKFTTANLIAMFLALILCLISQPWGSLIYSPLRKKRWSWFSWIVTACFFLWRLNPLACAAETVLIVASFLYSVFRSWNQPFGKQIEALHACAVALLLLRTGEYDDTMVKAAIKRHLEASLNAADTSLGVHSDSARLQIPAALSQSGQDPDSTSDIADQLLPASIPLRRSTIPQTQNTTQQQQSRGSVDEQESAPELPVIARRQWLVGLVVIFGAFTVLVKLLAVSIPWPIRTVAFSMWMSWFTVQITLYLYDLRDVDDRVLRATLDAVSHHTFVANHMYLIMFIHFLIVPAMIYVGYVVTSSLGIDDSIGEARLLHASIFPWIMEHSPPLQIILFYGLSIIIYTPLTIVYMIPFYIVTAGILLLFLILVGRTSARFSRVGFPDRNKPDARFMALSLAMTLPGTLGFICFIIFSPYADIYINYAPNYSWMLTTVGILYLSFILASRYFNNSGTVYEPAICLNIFVWVYLFIGVLNSYDATSTYKPGWLEYLG